MLPLVDARNKARADVELAEGAKLGLAAAMVRPYESAAGQGTRSYVHFRMPRLAYVLLAADPADPEWDTACLELRELCISAMRGGYDVARDLPDFGAVAFRAMVAEMASADSTPPAPAPSMTDVMAKTRAEFEHSAMEAAAARNVVDDRRGAAPVRNPPKPSYLQVPRIRDLGIGDLLAEVSWIAR